MSALKLEKKFTNAKRSYIRWNKDVSPEQGPYLWVARKFNSTKYFQRPLEFHNFEWNNQVREIMRDADEDNKNTCEWIVNALNDLI